MCLDEFLSIPEWFFRRSPLRIAWMDLLEGWIYLEIEAECPMCLNIEQSTWVVSVEERDVLEGIKCGRCGYPIGRLVLKEIDRFVAEIESMLRRLSAESPNVNGDAS